MSMTQATTSPAALSDTVATPAAAPRDARRNLIGLTREELAYILDTFPIVRRKDEARWGEYRTKKMVLEKYEGLQGVSL